MFSETYSLIRSILNDEELNNYIFSLTGKHLSVIDAGAQITTPSAKVLFNGGEFSRASNTKHEINFIISFALPLWGTDAFFECLEFLEFFIPLCFQYSSRRGGYISFINPSIVEQENDKNFWIINFNLTIAVFI